MGRASSDAAVVDGRCCARERTIVRELLADAAIGESISAGYAPTQLMHLTVERRIERCVDEETVDKQTVDAVVDAVRLCDEQAHVVVVVRADQQEACVCTVHGMRWVGEGVAPKVVLKLTDVPAGVPCKRSRHTAEPAPRAHEEPCSPDEDLERAEALLIAWIMVGVVAYLLCIVLRAAGRLAVGGLWAL